MKPKPPKVEEPKVAHAYEVVSDNDETQFRSKVENLLTRKFVPVGGIDVTVSGQNRFFSQAFIREGMHKYL